MSDQLSEDQIAELVKSMPHCRNVWHGIALLKFKIKHDVIEKLLSRTQRGQRHRGSLQKTHQNMDRSAGQPARSSQGSTVEIIIPILIKIYNFCFEPLQGQVKNRGLQ